MQTQDILKAIHKLPRDKKFYVIEQILKEIKNEELNQPVNVVSENPVDGYSNSNDLLTIAEKSFGEEWLTDEDNRWDKLL